MSISTPSPKVAPSRIALARQRRGLTATALADRINVARQTIAAWEAGTQDPLAEHVAALAEALGFPTTFFTGSEIEPFPVGAVSFRSMSKMTAGTRGTALASGRVSMLIGEWMEARYNLPPCDVPTLGKFSPQQAADVLRQRWDLGFGPIKNMLHLMEAKGVRVFSLPMECHTVDAYSLYWESTPFVVLTPGKTSERRRFDLAHELGHLVLHAELEGFQGQQAENEANAFAAAFLMPREGLLSRPLRSATLDVLLREKLRWKVSAMALAHRLHELKFFTDWEYRSTCIELSRQGYRRSEPGGIPHETSLMLGKVMHSLRRKGVAPTAIADELGISREDFSAHLLGLTVVNIPKGTEAPRDESAEGRPTVRSLRLA